MSVEQEAQGTRWMVARIERLEDRRFLTGSARYTGDHDVPRTLHAAFVRSPYAHARVGTIDTSAALALEGVEAVLTGADTAAIAPLVAGVPMPGLAPTPQPVLPVDKVRFVGQAVALVVARDRYIAEDAVDLVTVNYEPLPAVTTVAGPTSARQPAPVKELGSNVVYRHEHRHGDVPAAFAGGSADVPAHVPDQPIRRLTDGDARLPRLLRSGRSAPDGQVVDADAARPPLAARRDPRPRGPRACA